MTNTWAGGRMSNALRAGYDETLADMRTLLSCPQCRARILRAAWPPPASAYVQGIRLACLEVLLRPHECGEQEGGRGVGL